VLASVVKVALAVIVANIVQCGLCCSCYWLLQLPLLLFLLVTLWSLLVALAAAVKVVLADVVDIVTAIQ